MTSFKLVANGQAARIDDDGVSRATYSVDHPEYIKWLADGNAPEPYDDPENAPEYVIEREERAAMLPRVVREFMLGFMEANATQAQLAKNPGYQKVKAFDDRIKALRGKIK